MPQVALVGGAHVHTPGFIKTLKARAGQVQTKCVWDHDAARAKKCAGELGVPVVEDLAAIWNDPQITAVVICSETNRHEELVVAAAKAKKLIFAEKPLGMGAKDGYAMLQAIASAGVLFQTGYSMRSDPKNLFIKEQITKGNFGTITRVRASVCHSAALGGWFDNNCRWMAEPKQSGVGGYGDLGTHGLDLLLWFMGDVSKATGSISLGTKRYPDCDEYGEGLLVFASGAMGTLAAGWDDVDNPVSLEICGTEGHAVVVNGELYFHSKKVPDSDIKKPWKQFPPGLPSALELFLDAVAGKTDLPLVTAREAAYRSAVMEAVYQGAREQKWTAPEAPPAAKP
ncbi:MAG: Gfo/Idh/MocA family oxidoreductase [Planctomycetota bacterium]